MEIVDVFLIAFALLYPCLEGMRDPLAFPIKEEVNKALHHLGFVIRACVGTSIGIGLDALLLVPAYGFYFWIVFNLFTGEGTTAGSDKWKVPVWMKVVGLVVWSVAYYFLEDYLEHLLNTSVI